MKTVLRVLLVALSLLGSTVPPAALAQSTPSITITTPTSSGGSVAEGDDFATTVLGNPWDMSELFPIPQNSSEIKPPDVESTFNVDGATIANDGIWRGVARNNDPQLYLLSQGYGQNQACCGGSLHWKTNDGYINPIDAEKYHIVSVRMKLTGANSTNEGQFLWHRGDDPNVLPETSTAFRTFDGWNTYTLDLKTLGAVRGSWSGIIKGFRFDPATTPGATIEIDWIRLLATPTAATNHTVQWQTANAPAGSVVDLTCSDSTGVVCTVGQNIPAAQGSAAWGTAHLTPGAYTISARMGADYAALKLNDPWNMDSAADAALSQIAGTFNQAISNGLTGFAGTTSGDDPQFLLNVPTPIDTSTYKVLTFNLRVNTTDAIARQVQVFWFANGAWQSSAITAVGSGMQQHSLNLSQYPTWTGQITGLRIDPAARRANGSGPVAVELSPVTLTTSGTDSRVFTATSPGPLTVNTAPQIQITEPSTSSGPDFATTVLRNPWDFSGSEDVQKVEFSSSQLANGILSGLSTPSNGPDFELNTQNQRINTSRFRYLTFKFRMDDSMHSAADQARDHHLKVEQGWAVRVLWWGPAGPPNDHCTSAWAVVEPYELVYTIDLATVPLEVGTFAGQPACGPQGKRWADPANVVTQFRFDPHEVPPPTGWAVDSIKLTGPQEAPNSLTIKWAVQEPNAGQTPLVDLFYSPVNTGENLTPITSVTDGSTSYTWNTSGMAPGTYYIVARIRDGLNTIQRASSAPFTTTVATAPCDPRPKIGVKSEPSGDGRLRVTVTASSPSNPLQSIFFKPTNGALIDIPGIAIGSAGNFPLSLTGSNSFTFFLRRTAAGQPATAPITVTDGCGEWTSLAGGGASAPF